MYSQIFFIFLYSVQASISILLMILVGPVYTLQLLEGEHATD